MSQETQVVIIQPSNPMEVLNLIDAASCERFGHDLAALVREGHIDPIEVRVKMKAWEKAFKAAETAIAPEVEREAAKHGKAFDFMGAKCEWVPTYTAYEYDGCGYPAWEEADAAERSAKSSKKDAETFLKNVKQSFTMVDDRTGEVITINPPLKKQTEGLRITIK